jgi:transposase-like protein
MSMFPTEEVAVDYFINTRYGGVLTCPHCGADTKVYRYQNRLKACHCKSCNNSFSLFAGTIFEKSSTDMRKWFFAVHLVLNARKGISGLQLQREIGVTYKTAWRMLQQIRLAMGNGDMRKAFSMLVEVDETYVGGKPRRAGKILGPDGVSPEPSKVKRGRGTRKTPVVGVKERSSGSVYAQVMLPDDEGKKLSGPQLLEVLDKVCTEGTTVISDDFSGYKILDKPGVTRYTHFTVNHSRGEYSAGGGIHTNGIESFWAVFKRGWYGTYHYISVKYMQRYVDEFCFRQCTRERPVLDVFNLLLKRSVLKPEEDCPKPSGSGLTG